MADLELERLLAERKEGKKTERPKLPEGEKGQKESWLGKTKERGGDGRGLDGR